MIVKGNKSSSEVFEVGISKSEEKFEEELEGEVGWRALPCLHAGLLG